MWRRACSYYKIRTSSLLYMFLLCVYTIQATDFAVAAFVFRSIAVLTVVFGGGRCRTDVGLVT